MIVHDRHLSMAGRVPQCSQRPRFRLERARCLARHLLRNCRPHPACLVAWSVIAKRCTRNRHHLHLPRTFILQPAHAGQMFERALCKHFRRDARFVGPILDKIHGPSDLGVIKIDLKGRVERLSVVFRSNCNVRSICGLPRVSGKMFIERSGGTIQFVKFC
jgi:hypothetical protein